MALCSINSVSGSRAWPCLDVLTYEQETSQAPADASVRADDERQSTAGKDETYTRMEDLEGRLRGLILRNSSSHVANASASANASAQISDTFSVSPIKNIKSEPVASDEIISGKDGRPQPQKAAAPGPGLAKTTAASPSPGKRGSGGGRAPDSGDQHDMSRARRRLNQSQRRQMGQLDLQSPPSIPSQNTRQLDSQVHPPKINKPQQRQMQDMPRTSDAPSSLHAPGVQPRQPNSSQQHYPKQVRIFRSNIAILYSFRSRK